MWAENNTRLSKQNFHLLWSETYDVHLKSSALILFYPSILIKGKTVFKERSLYCVSLYCVSRMKLLNKYLWKIYVHPCGHRRAYITPAPLKLLPVSTRRRQAKEKIHETDHTERKKFLPFSFVIIPASCSYALPLA